MTHREENCRTGGGVSVERRQIGERRRGRAAAASGGQAGQSRATGAKRAPVSASSSHNAHVQTLWSAVGVVRGLGCSGLCGRDRAGRLQRRRAARRVLLLVQWWCDTDENRMVGCSVLSAIQPCARRKKLWCIARAADHRVA